MVTGDLERIREGAAWIEAPRVPRLKGPGRRGPHVFYNPSMTVARDLTVAAIAAATREGDRVLDGMCGTGVLGVRASLEASHDLEVTLGDRFPDCVELAKRNIHGNSVDGAEAFLGDVNAVVAQRRFEYVDIDPFGSPVPFLGAALRESRDRQVISATATDLAVLCGAHPRPCLRRYGARPLRTPFAHEMAVRILLGYCARAAARFDLGLEPLLGAHAEHFVKVWFRVRRGAKRADDSLSTVSHFRFDPSTGNREFVDGSREAGPLWSGNLADETFLNRLNPSEWTTAEAGRVLHLLREEARAPALHHTTDEWAKRLRLSPPKLSRLMEALRDAGFQASPTHFHPRGFRTDASPEEIEGVVRAAAPR